MTEKGGTIPGNDRPSSPEIHPQDRYRKKCSFVKGEKARRAQRKGLALNTASDAAKGSYSIAHREKERLGKETAIDEKALGTRARKGGTKNRSGIATETASKKLVASRVGGERGLLSKKGLRGEKGEGTRRTLPRGAVNLPCVLQTVAHVSTIMGKEKVPQRTLERNRKKARASRNWGKGRTCQESLKDHTQVSIKNMKRRKDRTRSL